MGGNTPVDKLFGKGDPDPSGHGARQRSKTASGVDNVNKARDLERKQTTHTASGLLTATAGTNAQKAELKAIDARIKLRAADIQTRRFSSPGKRQSLLQDVLPLLTRQNNLSFRSRQLAAQSTQQQLVAQRQPTKSPITGNNDE